MSDESLASAARAARSPNAVRALRSGQTGRRRICRHCMHFENSSRGFESAFPGLTSFGSGFASVRDEDGVCGLHDRHVAAAGGCAGHVAAVPAGPAATAPMAVDSG